MARHGRRWGGGLRSFRKFVVTQYIQHKARLIIVHHRRCWVLIGYTHCVLCTTTTEYYKLLSILYRVYYRMYARVASSRLVVPEPRPTIISLDGIVKHRRRLEMVS